MWPLVEARRQSLGHDVQHSGCKRVRRLRVSRWDITCSALGAGAGAGASGHGAMLWVRKLHVSHWDIMCSALGAGASDHGDTTLGAEGPRWDVSRWDMTWRSGSKRSWRHDFGCGGSSEEVRGAMDQVSAAHGVDCKTCLYLTAGNEQ